MSKTASAPAPVPEANTWEDRRKFPRKPTLLRAVIAETNGENARDCTVLDISTGGAQVSAPVSRAVGTDVCLLDVGSQVAHFAKVVWSKGDRNGLSFGDKHAIGMGLAPHLSFLWRLLLEAKLRDIERDISKGVPAALAFMTADLSQVHLHFMTQRSADDVKFEQALRRANSLLKGET